MRSPHDVTHTFYSTRDNADPTQFAWPYGGIVEFYPDLALSVPSSSGYRVETTITSWHFQGSPPLDTGVDQAFGPREPLRVLWSKYPPKQLKPPDVYAYHIARVDVPVALAVTVEYTYQITDAAGTPIGPPLNGSIEGQFTIGLVYTSLGIGRQP